MFVFGFALFSKNTSKKKPVVALIFAGREEYLTILMKYLNKLMNKGMLDEIHFWQFTNNKDDVKYLESISNIHKTSPNFDEYRAIFPLIVNNSFRLGVKAAHDAHVLINNKYEIAIGGWSNTKSVMRKSIQGKIEVEIVEKEEFILDPSMFKKFVVKLENNTLSVNKLMNMRVDDNNITSVSIQTGHDSEGYWNYEETKNKNVKLFDTNKRIGPWNWGESYDYYLHYDFDILLKIDDDIVYMDLDRYKEFISFIRKNPKRICVFPNLINHAVSLYYNNRNNLIPNAILKERYIGKKSAIEVYDLYTDGSQAAKIHEFFLNNITVFTKNNIAPINLDEHRESICMFGIQKKNYNELFNMNLYQKGFDDEIYLYRKKGNVLYPRFVACHYQFGPQMKSGLDKRYLPEYANLAEI